MKYLVKDLYIQSAFRPVPPKIIEDMRIIEISVYFRKSRENWKHLEFSKIEKLRENKLIPAIAKLALILDLTFFFIASSFKHVDPLGNTISSFFVLCSLLALRPVRLRKLY